MNENTKLALVFVLGVVIGVLGATSSLFRGQTEQPAIQTVVNPTADDAVDEAEQGSGETPEVVAPSEQPAPESESLDTPVEPPQTQAEASTAETELAPADDEAEPGPDESAEESEPAEQDPATRFSCMLMQDSGQCRCYDVQTAALVEISAEKCRDQLSGE